MPTLNNHQSKKSTKMLHIGDSGAGKTGALASLANAGYKLIIADFDNGLDILINLVKPEFQKNIHYLIFSDKLKEEKGFAVPDGKPMAFANFLKACNNWEDLGGIETWDDKTVFVIDSLTHLSNAVMRRVLYDRYKESKSPKFYMKTTPAMAEWGATQRRIESLLALLYNESIKCNVIVNSHINFVETADGTTIGYPASAGKALCPKIATYFNTTIYTKITKTKDGTKHFTFTKGVSRIQVKNSNPENLPKKIPLENSLLTIIKALQSEDK